MFWNNPLWPPPAIYPYVDSFSEKLFLPVAFSGWLSLKYWQKKRLGVGGNGLVEGKLLPQILLSQEACLGWAVLPLQAAISPRQPFKFYHRKELTSSKYLLATDTGREEPEAAYDNSGRNHISFDLYSNCTDNTKLSVGIWSLVVLCRAPSF